MDEVIQTESEPLSTLSVFSFIPPRRSEPKERRYFSSSSQATERHLYDCMYHRAEGYDQRLHRDDREHAKSRGLNIHTEERSRPVAVLSSSEYGRRLPPMSYKPGRQFARVAHIRTEFYRKKRHKQLSGRGLRLCRSHMRFKQTPKSRSWADCFLL